MNTIRYRETQKHLSFKENEEKKASFDEKRELKKSFQKWNIQRYGLHDKLWVYNQIASSKQTTHHVPTWKFHVISIGNSIETENKNYDDLFDFGSVILKMKWPDQTDMPYLSSLNNANHSTNNTPCCVQLKVIRNR